MQLTANLCYLPAPAHLSHTPQQCHTNPTTSCSTQDTMQFQSLSHSYTTFPCNSRRVAHSSSVSVASSNITFFSMWGRDFPPKRGEQAVVKISHVGSSARCRFPCLFSSPLHDYFCLWFISQSGQSLSGLISLCCPNLQILNLHYCIPQP